MAVKGTKEKQTENKTSNCEKNASIETTGQEYSENGGVSSTAPDETEKDENCAESDKDSVSNASSDGGEENDNEHSNNDYCSKEDAQKTASKGSKDSSIFVGNAPVGIKVEKIKAHFSKYGKIKKCTVIKDKNGNKLRRSYPPRNISAIIYIDFTSEESARNACEENQKIFEGKRLRVSLARERKPINKEATLFVGNLKYTTSEEQLYDAFVEYGDIDMVRIIAGKGFGFVHFSDPTSVDKATEKNKSQFNGREIHVERSRPPIKKESSDQEASERNEASQNYIRKQQAPGGYLNFRRNQTRNQLALELLERVINVQYKRPRSGIKF